jgi:glycosyltransferase 2 family protein
MRKLIFLIVLFLAVSVVFLSFSEIQNIGQTLEKSNWIFLAIAVLFESLWLYNTSTTIGSIYRWLDMEESRGQLFLMATAANFVNVIAPSAGIGGIAVFLDSAKKRGQPSGRVTVMGILFVLVDYASFLSVLMLGLVVLVRRNNLTAGEITASIILILIALAMAAILFLGYRSSKTLGNILAWLIRLINRVAIFFIHRDYLKEESGYSFANDVAEGISIIQQKRKGLIWPFLFALNGKALLICVLAFSFLALGTPFSVGTLVGGFSIAYLFLIVSPTPSGVGFVESIFPVAMNSLRVPWAAAVLITLVYRGITFWFPFVVGFITFRILQQTPKKPTENKPEKEYFSDSH